MEDILCNKIRLLRFINKPVPSNTYLLIDGKQCLVIDPGSKEQTDVRDYILEHDLTLGYIILTHEHFDHCWGANYLLECFPACKTVATRRCAEWVEKPWNYFNQLYYNSDEMYQIKNVDLIAEDLGWKLMWGNVKLVFIDTPGHSDKGMCIELGGSLFTGDTILYRTKPLLKKKYGASREELRQSIEKIYHSYPGDTSVYPGHGEPFELKDTEDFLINI